MGDSKQNARHAEGGVIFYVDFHGTAWQYFRIWFVNTLLTIITLGVYSAWAKVRNKRYFYGCTRIAGVNFEYHARPLEILAARAVVLAVIVGGVVWAGQDAIRNAYWTLILGLFLPWALVRGLSFNARNSSWSGARLSFVRGYFSLYLIFAPLLFFYAASAAQVSFGGIVPEQQLVSAAASATLLLVIALPVMLRYFHRYKAGRHRIGELRFYLHPVSIFSYYGAVLWPLIWGTLILGGPIVLIVLVAGVASAADPANRESAALFTGLVIVLLGLFFFLVIQTALFRLFWGNLRASNGARFVCNVELWAFARLQFVNFLAVMLSAGLLHPWAKVRKTRYLTENMHLVAPMGAMEELKESRGKSDSALGEEMDAVEGFDFDIALV